MSKVLMLRCLVNERLTAAAEEIFALFERTIAEYEEELCRSKEENQRKQQILDSVLSPQVLLHRADAKKKNIKGCQIQTDSVQNYDKKQSETPTFSAPIVKSEDVEEQSSLLHQILTTNDQEPKQESHFDTPQDFNLEQIGNVSDDSEDWEATAGSSAQQIEAKEDAEDYKQIQKVIIDSDFLADDSDVNPKVHECFVCGKIFPRGSALKRHTVVHTGEKPYSCPICKKGFTQKGHLKVHMCSHTGLKPFNCSICKRGFTRKNLYQEHMALHKEKRLSPVCDKSFSQKLNALQDLEIQSEEQKRQEASSEKPYSCLECNTAFSSNLNLLRHMALHSGEKPFSCPFCQKGFLCKKDIDKHMKIHTGDETSDEYIT